MLTITDLKKDYGSFRLNCSLHVEPGAITGLIGQNGAGKTTTFKAVLGLISYGEGSIRIFGTAHTALTARDREKLGVVLSDTGYSEYLTAQDLASIQKAFYKEFSSREFLKKCREFQIPLDKKIQDFSTGMKAKLKVLCALSHNAKFLILDEPTVGLDVIARDEILQLFRSYMEEDDQRSILISSHISSDLEGLCDDLYMIHDGAIILHEDTDTLLDSYGLLKVQPAQFDRLDKRYLLRYKKETYGYSCLTDQKQFYLENYPDLVVEKGSIDEVITMMIKGDVL